MRKLFNIVSSFVFLAIIVSGCKKQEDPLHNHGNDLDTLKVVTLYGPTSYFDYRGEYMGIDYENVKRFAEDEGMVLEIKTVNNIPELISALKEGKSHLAAYPVPSISEYNSEVIHCGNQEVSKQLLVQHSGEKKVTDVTELIGKEIHVEKNSKYQYRLENLNEELGGGIVIIPEESDTITTEDLMQMVNKGEIEFTTTDSQTASLYKSAFPEIDTSLSLSADQVASWAVAPGLDSLAAKIDRWENLTHSSEFVKSIYKGYYDRTLKDDFDPNLSFFKKKNLAKGEPVSDYDNLFKKYARQTGFDWELLAAIAFCESRFNPSIESRFGAYGLMQVMPSTAKAVGIEPSQLGIPDLNVSAATKILQKLDKTLETKIKNPEERLKFVVAAYNSGLGHIYDAMVVADKNGLQSDKWQGNVSIAALMKSRPEYYNDPDVKHGYFRGRETVDFVDHVYGIYHYLKDVLSDSKKQKI